MSGSSNNLSLPSRNISLRLPKEDEEEEGLLALSLAFRQPKNEPENRLPVPPPPPPHSKPAYIMPSLEHLFSIPPPRRPSYHPYIPPPPTNPPSSRRDANSTRSRRSPLPILPQGKSETIPAPYPWATTRRAIVQGLDYLLANSITKIKGEVECKRCARQYEMEYDLQLKYAEVEEFILQNKCMMHDRAPPVWSHPSLPKCKFCDQENSVKPVPTKKRSINWLFLFLGQLIGCCKLSELRYFCKHTMNHRTGAKDRVLYLTYMGLCKQLNPNGPF